MFPKKEKSIDAKRSERNMKPTQGVFVAIAVLFGMYSLEPNQDQARRYTRPTNFLKENQEKYKKEL